MGKPRRPRAPRTTTTWEPKPALDPDVSAAPGPIPEPPIPEPEPAPATAEAVSEPEPAVPTAEAAPISEPVSIPAPEPVPAVADLGVTGVEEAAAPRAAEPAPALPAVRVIDHAPPAMVLAGAPLVPSGFRVVFDPEELDLAGIGDVITGYMRGEGAAAAAHLRALSDIRSPADLIRLQVGEVQRAADASLTCWSLVARKASRAFAVR